MSDADDENCIHHYHHHIHHNSGEGVPNWLNPKKKNAACNTRVPRIKSTNNGLNKLTYYWVNNLRE